MKRLTTLAVAFALVLMTTAAFAAEWTGTIVKQDGKLWFKSGENTLSITNPEKAVAYEGATVTVAGSADAVAKTVTIDTVTPA